MAYLQSEATGRGSRGSSSPSSQFAQSGLRVDIILQTSRYHGIIYYYFAYNFGGKLKIYLVSLLRYGNPDVQILGTLKIKLQIHRFLGILNKNIRLKIIFRVPIYF